MERNQQAERGMIELPTKPANIDEYIAGFPRPVQAVLEKIRATIAAAAPDAQEVISYRMPAFRQKGILLYFAAFKTHIGVYPPVSGDANIERALSAYRGPKGNLKFPLDRAIPYGLIRRIVSLRVKQNLAKAAAGARRRHRAPKAAPHIPITPPRRGRGQSRDGGARRIRKR
jgi:uncharacterized protein YdhG (YjbR/CyaY superfamily)